MWKAEIEVEGGLCYWWTLSVALKHIFSKFKALANVDDIGSIQHTVHCNYLPTVTDDKMLKERWLHLWRFDTQGIQKSDIFKLVVQLLIRLTHPLKPP